MPTATASTRSPLLWGLYALVGLLFAATGGLWVHYGTTVFFEAIRAGIAACF